MADEIDLDELAAQARTGDRRALNTLLRHINDQVLRRCGAILAYRADAEEACQDALMQVAKNINAFEGRSKFTTWLHPIVVNCTIQTYRSLRRRAGERAVSQLPVQVPDPRTTSVIAGARIDLLDALERLEQRTPELVAPFVLRDLADLEYTQIAERLGLPMTTIKFRISEARKFVRRELAVNG
jgi:RNA polymerase sigma-70 factor (ECF subfamily)